MSLRSEATFATHSEAVLLPLRPHKDPYFLCDGSELQCTSFCSRVRKSFEQCVVIFREAGGVLQVGPMQCSAVQCSAVLSTITARTELLPGLTAKWLESSPPNIGVDGLNPRGLKCDNRKGYIGGWIYPEYSVAWLIPVVGFDS